MGVEIEWIDSISAAATGNKIYRDTVPPTGKVEVADIANGNQIYQDDTVAEGTEYKYSIQAHDGAGDETTQEVEGENMDFITTAGASITNYVFDGGITSFMADEVVPATLLDGIVAQTWIVRMKLDALDVQHGVIGSTDSATALKMEIDASDNRMDLQLADTGVVTDTNGEIATDLAWHTIAWTTTGVLSDLYEDGVNIDSRTDGTFTGRTPGRPLAIGASVIGGGAPGYLQGKISDVQLYNRELTAAEVLDLANDITDVKSGLVANFAGNKTETEWTSEIGGYVLTNQGGVTTE